MITFILKNVFLLLFPRTFRSFESESFDQSADQENGAKIQNQREITYLIIELTAALTLNFIQILYLEIIR